MVQVEGPTTAHRLEKVLRIALIVALLLAAGWLRTDTPLPDGVANVLGIVLGATAVYVFSPFIVTFIEKRDARAEKRAKVRAAKQAEKAAEKRGGTRGSTRSKKRG